MEDLSKERELIKNLSDIVDLFPKVESPLDEHCNQRNQPECCKQCLNNKNEFCFCTLPSMGQIKY